MFETVLQRQRSVGAPVMGVLRKDGENCRPTDRSVFLSTHVITLTRLDAPVNLCRHAECSSRAPAANLGVLRGTSELAPTPSRGRISSRADARARSDLS